MKQRTRHRLYGLAVLLFFFALLYPVGKGVLILIDALGRLPILSAVSFVCACLGLIVLVILIFTSKD
jgi:hypothetical protein